MNLDTGHLLGTAISFGLVLFIIYRRFRRNFGRQLLKPGRLKFRIGLLGVIGALLLVPALLSPLQALATAAGLGIGITLALWAAKHTRFEQQDGKLYYIPHTYAGMVVSALFLGRIIYRFVVVSPSLFSVITMDSASTGPGDLGGFSAISHSPVTRAIFFILVGYYVYYYLYVLRESQHLKPEDWEKPTAPSTGGNV